MNTIHTHHAPRDEHVHDGSASTAARRPPGYDGWEIEEQLRHAFRVLGSVRTVRKEADEPSDKPKFRVDAGHGVPAPHSKRPRRSPRKVRRTVAKSQSAPARGDGFRALMAWSALSLGTMGFVCGLALLGWSANTGRADLWAIGSPIILAGQIVLLLGLVLQLDRLWRDSRRSAARLETVDEQIHDLKVTTSLLGTTHGPSAAFYAHWAGGAGPEILLSDLKGQLDLLAVKLAKE